MHASTVSTIAENIAGLTSIELVRLANATDATIAAIGWISRESISEDIQFIMDAETDGAGVINFGWVDEFDGDMTIFQGDDEFAEGATATATIAYLATGNDTWATYLLYHRLIGVEVEV